MGLIDAHAHLAVRAGATAALLQVMDRDGVERAIVVAGGAVAPLELSRRIAQGGEYDTVIDNAGVAVQCATTAGRLRPYYFANPLRGLAELAENVGTYAGVKLGPAIHGVPFTDPRTVAIVAFAAGQHLPVYAHCLARPGFLVEDFVELAREFPRATFILGHAGIGNADFAAIETIKPVPNMLYETSGGFAHVIRTAIQELGAARVLYGSEYPLQDPRAELAKLNALGLDDESYQLISRGNAQRLLA